MESSTFLGIISFFHALLLAFNECLPEQPINSEEVNEAHNLVNITEKDKSQFINILLKQKTIYKEFTDNGKALIPAHRVQALSDPLVLEIFGVTPYLEI